MPLNLSWYIWLTITYLARALMLVFQYILRVNVFKSNPMRLLLEYITFVGSASFIPVHSFILSSHLFFCLPLLLAPFTVPCRTVFAMPEYLEIWPYLLSFRFFTMVMRSGSCCEPHHSPHGLCMKCSKVSDSISSQGHGFFRVLLSRSSSHRHKERRIRWASAST